jgi:hypothetical protein
MKSPTTYSMPAPSTSRRASSMLAASRVDARHVRDDAAQVARQHAHAAADVEAAPGAVRDSGEDHAVVVQGVVPPRWVSAHHLDDLTAAVRLSRRQKGS